MHIGPAHSQSARAQMALEAIYNYQMPAGQELSAVSLSWGADERKSRPKIGDRVFGFRVLGPET